MKKYINMVLTAKELETKEVIIHPTVVVYDVLRATSTIITALANGARAVIPALGQKKALKLYQNFLDTGLPVVLGGERKGEQIDGFHLGNSPLEYTKKNIFDHIIIFTTTNGTRAMINSQKIGAEKIIIASLLNQSSIVEFLKNEPQFTIVCAGVRSEFAFEDFYAAGLMLYELTKKTNERNWILDDSALTALSLAKHFNNNPLAIEKGSNGRRLRGINRGEDIEFCSAVNRFSVLPTYAKDRVLLSSTVQFASN